MDMYTTKTGNSVRSAFSEIYLNIFPYINIFSNNILSFLAPIPATFMYSYIPSVG